MWRRSPKLRASALVVARGDPIPRLEITEPIADCEMALPQETQIIVATRVSNVRFTGQRVFDFGAEGAEFINCTFVNCEFENGTLGYLPGAVYANCDFVGIDFQHVDPGVSRFDHCAFESGRVSGWRATAAEFVGCSFTGRVVDSVFFGRPFGAYAKPLAGIRTRNEFVGNNFSAAELEDVDFREGIDLDLQEWPHSDAYAVIHDWPARVAAIAAGRELFSSDSSEVADLLEVFDRTYGGRQIVFLERRELSSLSPTTADELWRLLSE